MGKPRMILLIRHAQSEGNKNRDIHQMIPDHRVKLTPEGWQQAEEAGRRLRSMLRPDDTLQFFTSPYRRTRETTEGILKSLTSDSEAAGPSPYPRQSIKVYEEPRLREQDFGNFQPCSAEMERMWQERADYGHFFYRIANGESAADAYDRISGFNESLWRSFNDDDFPSVCVLVTHGLMTRVFLMKWYHWSVEYFEDLRNINHCEFVTMKRNPDTRKFTLENQLRTWSELKRRAASTTNLQQAQQSSPAIPAPAVPARKWGGCVAGCDHHQLPYKRKGGQATVSAAHLIPKTNDQIPTMNPREDRPVTIQGPAASPIDASASTSFSSLTAASDRSLPVLKLPLRPPLISLNSDHEPGRDSGRDGGGSRSGMPTPVGGAFSDSGGGDGKDYFRGNDRAPSPESSHSSRSNSTKKKKKKKEKRSGRRPTAEDMEQWAHESGMGRGTRADALGDDPVDDDEDDDHHHGHGDGLVEEVAIMEERDKSLRGSVY